MLKGIQWYVDPGTLGPFEVKKMFEALADKNEYVSRQILEVYDFAKEPGWGDGSFAHPVTDQTWLQLVRVFLDLDEVMNDKYPRVSVETTGAAKIVWCVNPSHTFEVLLRDGRAIWSKYGGWSKNSTGSTRNLRDLREIAGSWK